MKTGTQTFWRVCCNIRPHYSSDNFTEHVLKGTNATNMGKRW